MLRIRDLRTHFFTGQGVVKAVDGVDLEVHKGEVLGIVGESGSGKSVTALSIMQLVASPPGRIVSGRIELDGLDMVKLDAAAMRRIRGKRISMIFQDPLASLNPVLRIGFQLGEVFRHHLGLEKRQAVTEAERMLRAMDIPSPATRVRNYPHQLSGGMRQRAMIAMALSCKPELLIADEPTTALDVTVQAQVLNLMKQVCREHRTALVLITHDMGVIANMCERVAVMYAGKVVEYTDVRTLFRRPGHPYAAGLLRSLPRLGGNARRLQSIEGQPPRLTRLPPGCAYAPRCPRAQPRCREEAPELVRLRPGQEVRCHFPLEGSLEGSLQGSPQGPLEGALEGSLHRPIPAALHAAPNAAPGAAR
ncbi:MAG: ABC transporter ATP-binding protein [Alphaproteobacteria bacterium]|nr:ABC transporter ATP-binding protein [Alphaproteobacteria bacterium]